MRTIMNLILFFFLILLISCIANKDEVIDSGDFVVKYYPLEDKRFTNLESVLKNTRMIEEIADDLNKKFKLPYDIEIAIGECGEPNVFYEDENKRIIFCYELGPYVSEKISDAEKITGMKNLEMSTGHTVYFFIYHEVGHALIKALNLPITGREEDAVDQFSTILLVESGRTGEEAVISSALFFLLNGLDADKEKLPFYDEHALDEQRSFNLICWTYGKNPKISSDIETILPLERAIKCGNEYSQMFNSWNRMLLPYLKI